MIVSRKCHFVIVYVILIASTNVTFARATAVCNAILVTEVFCYRYLTFDFFGKINISQRNLAVASGIYWGLSVRNVVHIHLDFTFLLHV